MGPLYLGRSYNATRLLRTAGCLPIVRNEAYVSGYVSKRVPVHKMEHNVTKQHGLRVFSSRRFSYKTRSAILHDVKEGSYITIDERG